MTGCATWRGQDLILQMMVKILKQKTVTQGRDYAVLTKIVIVDMRV